MMLPAALQARLKPLADRIDALSLRERALIFIGVMGAIFIIAMNVVLTPLRVEHNRLETSLRGKDQQIQTLNREIQTMLGNSAADIDAPQREKIAALEQELVRLDQQLEQITGGTVSPQQMTKLLEQMLLRNRMLELVKIENLPATAAVQEEAQPVGTPSKATIYKHGVRVELRGRYFDVVEYLKAIETLPWKVFWGQVSLETDKYPISKMTLVVYTLSRHPGWVGI